LVNQLRVADVTMCVTNAQNSASFGLTLGAVRRWCPWLTKRLILIA
jgi:hypothetical protein